VCLFRKMLESAINATNAWGGLLQTRRLQGERLPKHAIQERKIKAASNGVESSMAGVQVRERE